MEYLCMNRLGALGLSGRHPEAGVILSHIHPLRHPIYIVACTTLLPTICYEHWKGRD